MASDNETLDHLLSVVIDKTSIKRFADLQSPEFQLLPQVVDEMLNLAASGRGKRHRVADLRDQRVDQRAVVGLRHHPDHRLGAGGADDEPAVGRRASRAPRRSP